MYEQMNLGLDSQTVEEARHDLFRVIEKGVTCPVCERHAQRYKLRLNAGTVRILFWLYKQAGLGWIHVPTYGGRWIVTLNKIGELQCWGLVKEKRNLNTMKKESGIYRLTEKGLQFIFNEILVQEYCWYYNGQVHRFGGGKIGIHQALQNRFDYKKLMAGVYE